MWKLGRYLTYVEYTIVHIIKISKLTMEKIYLQSKQSVLNGRLATATLAKNYSQIATSLLFDGSAHNPLVMRNKTAC